jgi:hypothetical protein
VAELAQLPGGALPIATLPPAISPPRRLEQRQVTHVEVEGAGGRRDGRVTRLTPPGSHDATRPLDSDYVPAVPAPATAEDKNAALDGRPDRLIRLSTLELMRRLSASAGDEAARIEAELEQRGFNQVHLVLAARLCDPNPMARIELARRLPEMQSINAVPWLLWLCEDQDSEVRLTAVTLLATTGDPRLLRRVRDIALRDADPRIRQQAERIAQKHGGAWR